MKRVMTTTDDDLDTMLGEKVTLIGGVYIYTGVLSGVSDVHVKLDDPKLVYETGPLMDGEWKDAQSLPSPWRVMLANIESWGPAKC